MDSLTDTASAARRIAYLARFSFESGAAHRCGMLVVDEMGIPQEFRCTAPVRPNDVQRRLYGKSLEPYMLIEAMGKPLLREVKSPYELLIVNDPHLLNLRTASPVPVVMLQAQGELQQPHPDLDENVRTFGGASADSTLIASVFKGQTSDRDSAYRSFDYFSLNVDLLEPFARIGSALEMVHKEKELDKA